MFLGCKNLAVNHLPLERDLVVQTWTTNLTARHWSRDFLTFAVHGKYRKTSILSSLFALFEPPSDSKILRETLLSA